MTFYQVWLLVLTVAMFVCALVAAAVRDVRWAALSLAGFAAYLFTVVMHNA